MRNWLAPGRRSWRSGSPVERPRGAVEQLLDVDFSRNEVLLQRIVNDRGQPRPAALEPEREEVDGPAFGSPAAALLCASRR